MAENMKQMYTKQGYQDLVDELKYLKLTFVTTALMLKRVLLKDIFQDILLQPTLQHLMFHLMSTATPLATHGFVIATL